MNISRATLLFLGATMLNTACTFQEDDFFDESASLRINHTNDLLQERLISQSSDENHGWVIQYFVAGTDEADFEGFNIFGRFYENGKVTLAGNHRFLRNGNANKYTEHSSSYEFLSEEGPVLSFNTWNDILTVFEDPVDPSTLAQDGEGMFGDHNLVLRSYNDNEIVFSGERHSAKVRFIPCDRPWTDYIDAVNDTKNYISSTALTTYYVTDGVDTMYFSRLNRGYFNYCDRVDDPLNNKVLSCVFTPTGFRIEKTDTLGGHPFQEFTLAADSTCLLNEDGSVKVIAAWDNYVVSHTTVWKFDTATLPSQLEDLYNKINAEILNFNKAWSLESVGIGQSSGTNKITGLVLTFYTNAAKTKTNTAGVALTMQKTGYGQMKIVSVDTDNIDKNMETIAKSAPEVVTYARSFANLLNGTYNIVPNHYFMPTGGTYTPVSGGTAFTMSAE